MIRHLLKIFLSLPLLLLPLAVPAAQATDPEALVKDVTEEVLSILRQDKELQSGNRQRAVGLIDTKVAPHFDFPRMTALAVGRGWREATPAQQEELAKEFRTLLVRTYANALTTYRDQTVSFKPGRGDANAGEVTVRSQINQAGAPPVALDYQLARSEGGWKVFDVAIDNVSLVTNYRGNFQAEMAKGGIDGLTKALQAKNRNLESSRPAG